MQIVPAFCILHSAFLFACKHEQSIGDAKHGKELMNQYGCVTCHDIPGVQGAHGMVGPPLSKMALRQTIGGKFPNTPDTMIKWLENPQALNPQTSMPNMGVTPADARDMTAYLDTLK
jgi:cytochrome c2